MPLPPTARRWLRRACRWSIGALFLFLLHQLGAHLLGVPQAVRDSTTIEIVCGVLFFPAALGLLLIPDAPRPSRGGEMGSYRGPTPPGEPAGNSPPMPDLFRHPPKPVLIAPSILSADFGAMADDAGHILRPADQAGGGADLLHVDIMDGHFAPNLTMGPDMVRGIRRHLPDAFCDIHLMVMDPARFIEPFARAGASHCTFHIERVQRDEAIMLADHCRTLGITAGICLNPPTPVDEVLKVIAHFDLVLIMSVNPGFSGQKFMPDVLPKAAAIKKHLRPDQRLEIDGGVNPDNAPTVRAAGIDTIVAANAIFSKPRPERAAVVSALRG